MQKDADTTLVTPTGTQTRQSLFWRRCFVLVLNILTFAGLLFWMIQILQVGGWTWVDMALLACFAFGLPWTVMGFWNAIIGLLIGLFVRDIRRVVAPYASEGETSESIVLRTAVVMTLRNENPTRALSRLRTIKNSLDVTGFGAKYDYFILSDTSDPIIAANEEAVCASWRDGQTDPSQVTYRRRQDNTGFKAGNLHDFCTRWGDDYDLMLPLDADSLMTGETIVRLTRIMQAHPKLGILQSLVVGLPSESAFARIFQFGMRHGMRPYTLGSAWWSGDCGPYWGHNAILRIAPFHTHCRLPVLTGSSVLSGPVLSHDQIEAVFMRRAGYEVRVLPEECGSWEDNPPTLSEFCRRDARWCQGNLQYLKLLRLPDLHFMGRFQLLWAILMFISLPAWTLMMILVPLKLLDGEPAALFPVLAAKGLYFTFLVMSLMPKLAGFMDILFTRGGPQRYGGIEVFISSMITEIIFSFLLGAVTTFRITVFMVGLMIGRSGTWTAASRDVQGMAWMYAVREYGLAFLFGCVLSVALVSLSPLVFLYALPLLAGYLLAIPLAVFTASPTLGVVLRQMHICAVPEEFFPPSDIQLIPGS